MERLRRRRASPRSGAPSSGRGLPGGHVGLLRRGHPVPAAAPTCCAGVLDAVPRAAGRRGHRRVQSRGRDGRPAGRLPGGRGDPDLPRRAVDRRPTCWRAWAGATARPRGRGRAAAVAAAGFAIVEPRPDPRRGRGDATTTGQRSLDRRARPGAPAAARQRLRPDRRAGHAAGRGDPARHPDDDVQAGRYEAADGSSPAAGYRLGGDLELGPPGPRVPAQPPLLGAGRLPGHRLGRPLPPRRAAVVERAHARPLRRRWWRPAGRPRPAEEVLDAPASGEFEAPGAGAAHAGRGARARPARATPELDGLVTASDGRAVLTVRGRLLANAVTGYLVDHRPAGPRGRRRWHPVRCPLCPSRNAPPTPPDGPT